jgi:hypothetical protein
VEGWNHGRNHDLFINVKTKADGTGKRVSGEDSIAKWKDKKADLWDLALITSLLTLGLKAVSCTLAKFRLMLCTMMGLH